MDLAAEIPTLLYAQQRHRPTCASMLPDQRLRYSLMERTITQLVMYTNSRLESLTLRRLVLAIHCN